MHKIYLLVFPFLYFFLFTNLRSQSTITTDQLIVNVQLIDGTGTPARKASVRIRAGKIIAVGQLTALKGELIIDGKGLILAPGFIDSHSHHLSYLKRHPEAMATSNQGITTIVIGQDGSGEPMDTLESFFNMRKAAVNIASYTGHTSLREMTMGENDLLRKASEQEIEKMKGILQSEMRKGSLGLSTGLEYEGAFYSSPEEVIELAKVAAAFKGRYISHIRSEDLALKDAIEEIITIGRVTGMPVKLSHIKIANKDDWGSAVQIIARLEKARADGIDITADVYPYTYWNSTLKVLFPDKQYTNLKSAQLAVDKLFEPDSSMLVRFLPDPSYEGKTIGEIARIRNEKPARTLIALIAMAGSYSEKNANADGVEAIAGKAMSESDVKTFTRWRHSNICSDGNAGRHPRGFGSFTRVLGKYVREEQILSLPEAIFKMTGMTAAHLGFTDRGLIKPGYYADLVLLDPNSVSDKATLKQSNALSTGVEMVWVNGQPVFEKQKATGFYPGMLIRKKS